MNARKKVVAPVTPKVDARREVFEALEYLASAFEHLMCDDELQALKCMHAAKGHLQSVYSGPLGTYEREAEAGQ